MVFLIGEYLAIKGRLRRTNKEKNWVKSSTLWNRDASRSWWGAVTVVLGAHEGFGV